MSNKRNKNMTIYRHITSLIFLVISLLPVGSVLAQMTSNNYSVDSYTIGENGTGYSTSTNYQSTHGATNLEVADSTATTSSEDTSGSVSGGYIDYGKPATRASTTEPTTPLPYVAPVPDDYIDPPTTATDATENGLIAYVPIYRENDPERAGDNTVVQLSRAVNDQIGLIVTIPNQAFVIPDDHSGSMPYKIYVLIQEYKLPAVQQPDGSYGAVLLRDRVYAINFVDSLGNTILTTLAPIKIELMIGDTLDYSLDTKGYVFDRSMDNWLTVADIDLRPDTVTFFIERPVLFGLWGGKDLPAMMQIVLSSETTDVAALNECPVRWYGLCSPWPQLIVSVTLLLCLYFLLRRFYLKLKTK